VTQLVETETGVEINGITSTGIPSGPLTFEKVFLGAGSLESFRILALSQLVPKVALLTDSATFFVPLLASPMLGKPTKKEFALSQCFVRINSQDENASSQFQIYEYSEDLILRAQKTLPLGKLIPKFIWRYVLQKMMVAIGYLSGEASPRVRMELNEVGDLCLSTSTDGISITRRNSNIKNSIKILSNEFKGSGLWPMSILTQFALPGEGVHYGSWLPMGESSDLLGRPFGCKNVHVVDSSVLPSIAPGPITFTIMANAMRIAEESCK
jgi:hypothetical protein